MQNKGDEASEFSLLDELFNVVFFGKFYAKGLFRSIFRNYWSDHKYGPPYTNAEHVKWLPLGTHDEHVCVSSRDVSVCVCDNANHCSNLIVPNVTSGH